ncbi:hypothetical protein [Pseudonocardia thermophila]|uniref:hypothetical protein n=1 Tax=Pseudonocardia thermophila TaxID=1848 RepID=UPI00248E3F8C|nr:hypothetical protein [Pseudonocardia thermophila]
MPTIPFHAGIDASGRVRVGLDASGHDVRVALLPGWRTAPGPGGLGRAVVDALDDAVVARTTAWARAIPAPRLSAPRLSTLRLSAPQERLLRQAHQELAEFRQRLAELRAEPVTVEVAGVRVTVRHGRVARVRITGPATSDAALASALAAALRAALATIAAQPVTALAGSPALRFVLGPPPFTL